MGQRYAWMARVYSPTDPGRCVGECTISDRTEAEAYREAEAWAMKFIVLDDDNRQCDSCDWSMTRLEGD